MRLCRLNNQPQSGFIGKAVCKRSFLAALPACGTGTQKLCPQGIHIEQGRGAGVARLPCSAAQAAAVFFAAVAAKKPPCLGGWVAVLSVAFQQVGGLACLARCGKNSLFVVFQDSKPVIQVEGMIFNSSTD